MGDESIAQKQVTAFRESKAEIPMLNSPHEQCHGDRMIRRGWDVLCMSAGLVGLVGLMGGSVFAQGSRNDLMHATRWRRLRGWKKGGIEGRERVAGWLVEASDARDRQRSRTQQRTRMKISTIVQYCNHNNQHKPRVDHFVTRFPVKSNPGRRQASCRFRRAITLKVGMNAARRVTRCDPWIHSRDSIHTSYTA
jgi:hypothetical protein